MGLTSDRNDEFTQMYKYFYEWTPLKDVFAVKYFGITSTAFCSASAAYINTKCRIAVRLRGKGYFSSFLPMVIIPAIIGTSSHFIGVVRPTLMRTINCPICLEIRSGLLFVGCGVIFPFVFAPINAFSNAIRYYTFAIPDITKQPKETFKCAIKTFKPILPKIFPLSILMFSAGMLLAHLEEYNYQTVMEKVNTMAAILEENEQKKLKKTNT